MLTVFVANAQSSQMATLLHDGTITNFYSATALKEALDAAEDGDVISLSSGVFQAADITKNITIRGAGMTVQGFNENEIPTVITGTLNIKPIDADNSNIILEGIQHNEYIHISNINNLTFNKCQLNNLHTPNPKDNWKNLTFLHCYITGTYYKPTYSSSSNFINCVITYQLSFSDERGPSQLCNCIIYSNPNIRHAIISNSIIIMPPSSYIEKTATINNCVIVNCTNYSSSSTGNLFLNKDHKLFKDNSFYQLTDELKEFKGTDGSEVGIHGGNLPFTPVTSRPRITKFNVGSKTTADGKLSVDIEITGEE